VTGDTEAPLAYGRYQRDAADGTSSERKVQFDIMQATNVAS
jgi:hypothetical protein